MNNITKIKKKLSLYLMNHNRNIFIIIFIFIILFFLFSYNKHIKLINCEKIEKFTYYLYKKHFGLSVIVLNYNRPHNIPILVNKLKKNKLIDDIIISHGKEDTEILINDPIVTNETILRNKYYSATRFELSKMAKNNFILFIDDDLYPDKLLINDILLEIKEDGFENNLNLYGPFKRNCVHKYIHKFQEIDSYTRLNLYKGNIILTGLAIVNKKTAIRIWNKIKNTKYLDIILENKGNGEDIVFSTFIRIMGGKNKYIPGKYYNLDNSDGYSSMNKHYKVRSELCKKLYNDRNILEIK